MNALIAYEPTSPHGSSNSINPWRNALFSTVSLLFVCLFVYIQINICLIYCSTKKNKHAQFANTHTNACIRQINKKHNNKIMSWTAHNPEMIWRKYNENNIATITTKGKLLLKKISAAKIGYSQSLVIPSHCSMYVLLLITSLIRLYLVSILKELSLYVYICALIKLNRSNNEKETKIVTLQSEWVCATVWVGVQKCESGTRVKCLRMKANLALNTNQNQIYWVNVFLSFAIASNSHSLYYFPFISPIPLVRWLQPYYGVACWNTHTHTKCVWALALCCELLQCIQTKNLLRACTSSTLQMKI